MNRQLARWHVFPDAGHLYAAATNALLHRARLALEERGCFRFVVPGGRTPLPLFRALHASGVSLARWDLYLSDERCLPPDHAERNSRLVEDLLLRDLGSAAPRLHAIPAELGPDAAAKAYQDLLAEVDQFDVVLLGFGPDGHTASLFPGHPWGEGDDAPAALPVRGAPKWPSERVSLSVRRLAASRRVVFVACGDDKSPVVNAWHGGARMPLAAVAPPGGVDVLLTGACADIVRPRGAADDGTVF